MCIYILNIIEHVTFAHNYMYTFNYIQSGSFWGLFTLRSAARFETTTLPPTTADAVFFKSLYTTHDLSSLQEYEWSNCAFLLEAVSWHFFNDMPPMSRKQNTCFAQSAIYIHTCIHTLPYITLHCVALRYTTVHCITYHIYIYTPFESK